ncbi:hypothetical protein N4P33_04300 [Streptomyces sp. 15-116A]|uniref:hypothetical protein n=1 Tax=Streptomyces sp. 15-116A TaxID=2259035 RepID=UPI0021B1FAEC|nr:hypothetical protein [Streptomyces sp. 15-116A]MCT7351391.1 hypothetical protein [Streptomyces sp. 15-116A]
MGCRLDQADSPLELRNAVGLYIVVDLLFAVAAAAAAHFAVRLTSMHARKLAEGPYTTLATTTDRVGTF